MKKLTLCLCILGMFLGLVLPSIILPFLIVHYQLSQVDGIVIIAIVGLGSAIVGVRILQKAKVVEHEASENEVSC